MVSVLVSGILSSAVTAVITSLVCLVLRKRKATKQSLNTTPAPVIIYDSVTQATAKETAKEIAAELKSADADFYENLYEDMS